MTTSLAPTPISLHVRLKAATADLHRATEEVFDPQRRLSSMVGYVDLLDRLWSLHAGVERALWVFGPDLFGLNLDARRRSPLLALDLEATAGRPPRLAPTPFAYASPTAALGGLYVLEGSTLGGRVLFRRAQASLGFADLEGARFLNGSGSDTGLLWRAFVQALGRVPAAGEAGDQAEAGARLTFDAFRKSFAKDGSADAAG